jgi:hypothetical protein
VVRYDFGDSDTLSSEVADAVSPGPASNFFPSKVLPTSIVLAVLINADTCDMHAPNASNFISESARATANTSNASKVEAYIQVRANV